MQLANINRVPTKDKLSSYPDLENSPVNAGWLIKAETKNAACLQAMKIVGTASVTELFIRRDDLIRKQSIKNSCAFLLAPRSKRYNSLASIANNTLSTDEDRSEYEKLSPIESLVLQIHDLDKRLREPQKASQLISDFIYPALVRKEYDKVEEFMNKFLEQDFSIDAQSAILSITRRFKKQFSNRETIANNFIKHLFAQNWDKKEIQNIIEHIVE